MFKIKRLAIALALTSLFIGLTACGGGTTTTDNKGATNKPAENKPAENKPAENKPAENKPADNKSTAGGDKIGVAECDEYLEKVEACVMEKIPEAQRTAFKSTYEQNRKAWKDAAANPQAKAALATSCKTALDTAKQSMGAFGCKW
jgi:hypothetical protein